MSSSSRNATKNSPGLREFFDTYNISDSDLPPAKNAK